MNELNFTAVQTPADDYDRLDLPMMMKQKVIEAAPNSIHADKVRIELWLRKKGIWTTGQALAYVCSGASSTARPALESDCGRIQEYLGCVGEKYDPATDSFKLRYETPEGQRRCQQFVMKDAAEPLAAWYFQEVSKAGLGGAATVVGGAQAGVSPSATFTQAGASPSAITRAGADAGLSMSVDQTQRRGRGLAAKKANAGMGIGGAVLLTLGGVGVVAALVWALWPKRR